MQVPHLIDLQKIGEEEIGYISVAQAFSNVPFEIKRVYWTYNTPDSVERGNHAHKNSLQLLVCLSGKMKVSLESREGKIYEFILDDPNKGLFMPHYYWRKLKFYNKSISICLSSLDFDEDDYIRDYQNFLNS